MVQIKSLRNSGAFLTPRASCDSQELLAEPFQERRERNRAAFTPGSPSAGIVPPPCLHIYWFVFLSTNLLFHHFGISVFISASTDSLSFFSCSAVFPSPSPAAPAQLSSRWLWGPVLTLIYLIIFARLPLCSMLPRKVSSLPPLSLNMVPISIADFISDRNVDTV